MNGFRSVRSFSSSLNIKIIIYVYIVGCFERGSLVIQRQNTHKIDEHDTNEWNELSWISDILLLALSQQSEIEIEYLVLQWLGLQTGGRKDIGSDKTCHFLVELIHHFNNG